MDNNTNILNSNGEKINAKLIFAFTAFSKDYVVLNFDEKIFNENSKYDNLNIFEISKIYENNIYIKDLDSSSWDKIKDFLQKEIFNNY